MTPLPNRKALRRAYLRKKGTAYVELTTNGLFLPLVVCAGIACTVVTFTTLWSGDGITATFTGPVAFVCGFAARRTWRDLRNARHALTTSYVPPVTASTLPADEVLVRASTEPDAPQESLLRAAHGAEESKSEELLRSHLP